jgi:transposase
MKHLVGFDLHSDNVCGVLIDENEHWLLKRKFDNNLTSILEALTPYQKTISAIAVEATYNWYWLVDGLKEQGYNVRLAHPYGIEGRSGKKRTNDFYDAFHLAHLLRTNNFPDSYIYPKEERPLRDLLRKRMTLVQNRTQHLLSFINMVSRTLGYRLKTNEVKKITDEQIEALFEQEHLFLSGKANIAVVRLLNDEINTLEKSALKAARLKPQFNRLLSVPGIGDVIALTISFELGSLLRFRKVGNYLSYCRLVDSKCTSNGKKKGENNRKSGNPYLCWAYIEAANFAKRSCPYAKAYFKHKFKECGKYVLAIKALASKIARATFYMMLRDEPYDPEKSFGNFSEQAKLLKREKESRGSKP